MLKKEPLKRLAKKTKRGFRGYPMAAIAAYGPDARRATKLVVSVFLWEGAEPEMRKWFSDAQDVRTDPAIAAEVMAFLAPFAIASVAMPDSLIGCPHEEGIDYEGETCPSCPYWAGRDRWTGETLAAKG